MLPAECDGFITRSLAEKQGLLYFADKALLYMSFFYSFAKHLFFPRGFSVSKHCGFSTRVRGGLPDDRILQDRSPG